MIGKLLGNRYELLERLGGGGMAVVYKGRDTFLNRMVTVKVLRSEYASDEAFVARFRREAQAVARLSHPNIVNIHDVGTEDEIHYLVMEFVDGRNLKTVIRNEAPISPKRAVAIIRQICDALQHAHNNNIVHRDVKPHNILITADGRAKLTDFGIAREASAATLTYTDTVVGSVHYLSPEQARGEVAGIGSDIYSLGVVAFELFSGKLPFEGDTPIGVAMKHVQEDPPDLKEISPAVTKPISLAVGKALQKRVEERFTSAEDMAQTLEAALDNESDGEEDSGDMNTRVLPAVGKNGGNKKNRNRRRYLWAGTITAFLLLLTAGVIFAWNQYLDTPDVKVPNVTGLPVGEAQEMLENKSLRSQVAGEEFSDQYDQGIVIRQSIGPDDPPAKPDRLIALTVSKGPDMREVPDLRGMSQAEAMTLLIENGLRLSDEENEEYSDEVDKGLIINQKPKIGTLAKKNSIVQITVSLGPEPEIIEMPDLIGLREGEARGILDDNNLQVASITWEYSSDITYGRITEQVPKAGDEVKEGTPVEIVLSTGPGPGTRNATVTLTDEIPNDGEEHKVEIIVEDAEGTHTEYANTHVYSEKFVRNITYRGIAVVRIYVDGKLVDEVNVE
ncbi:MAG: Stk1 family PASTA domain-containing Ser/Thr kinase [Firmicutes bacterium]|nr:Stk1 family PASTA domain-containing Ser/Thr kinase [Bacillota bacterium]